MALHAEDYSTIMNASSLHHKRGQKKGIATKVQTYLDSLKSKSLTQISVKDIALRDSQVSEAILSFDLIQARLEQIEDTEETARNSSAIEATQAAMTDIR